MTIYGETHPDGSLKQEADTCILTGRFVDPRNSVRERVTGTTYFYRISDSQYDRVTDALRQAWQAGAPKAGKAEKTEAADETAAKKGGSK